MKGFCVSMNGPQDNIFSGAWNCKAHLLEYIRMLFSKCVSWPCDVCASAHWNLIGSSKSVPLSVLSPSSILPPPPLHLPYAEGTIGAIKNAIISIVF
jgi:hypothetical protein